MVSRLETREGEIAGDHLGPLRAYLRAHYHVIKMFAEVGYQE